MQMQNSQTQLSFIHSWYR